MAKKALSEDVLKARAERIRKCISSSGVKQTTIANFCNVTTQSVGGWKKTGRVEPENLYKLAEITKYRYLWLRDGAGNELISDSNENSQAYTEDFSDVGYLSIGPLADYPGTVDFIAALNRFISQNSLKLDSLTYLTAFFNQMSGITTPSDAQVGVNGATRPSIEITLVELSEWLKDVPDETKYPIAELLKALCISPGLSGQLIQSILALSVVEDTGENPIRVGRARKGWSSAHLAEQIGVSRQTISSWESMDSDAWPERDKWERISNVLGVSLQDIASFSINKLPKI